MTSYARRALPWLLLGCCAALVLLAMALVARWPYAMWPLQGVAVALLGAAGAWCVDEPAAAVVDTTPRGLGWRTAARTLGLIPLLALWLALVVAFRGQLFSHAPDVAAQGCVALAVGCALGTWARSRGTALPGRRIAATAVPSGAYFALVRPLEERVPVFPYLQTGPWTASRLGWGLAAALAAGILVSSLAGPQARQVRS